jgi:hypothetical protein
MSNDPVNDNFGAILGKAIGQSIVLSAVQTAGFWAGALAVGFVLSKVPGFLKDKNDTDSSN